MLEKFYSEKLCPGNIFKKPKFFINQRTPAERGPFEGSSSYPQLCWWSLIVATAGLARIFTE
jgi:hypothetical protein